jgi:hypothetical protein
MLLPLLIVACIVLGILVLGLGGVAVWAWKRSQQLQSTATANSNGPAPIPQPVQAPPPLAPPIPEAMPANGPLAVELSNADISGFGVQIEVTANYRFTSGNPVGRRIFLFIKATNNMGLLQKQNFYVAELHNIGNKMQGTIHATGITFGIENGPFEMWLGEGTAGMIPPLISDQDLRRISNVVTIASKQPGMPGIPGMPGMPGMPRRPPFGPRGMRP